jgi:hypothetical protein
VRGAGGGGLSRRNRRTGGGAAFFLRGVFTWNLFFVRVHMEPFLGFCDSFHHYLQSLFPGVRRASGTAPAGLSSDLLPGYFRVTDEEFSLLFMFVCVNLSPANLLQGGSRPASRGQNKYSTQG